MLKCSVCGKKILRSSYDGVVLCGSEECWPYYYWSKIAREKDEHIIIDDECYTIGNEEAGKWSTRGYGGKKFIIKKSDDTIITTTNLWHNGNVPERFKELLPNNATFIEEVEQ